MMLLRYKKVDPMLRSGYHYTISAIDAVVGHDAGRVIEETFQS